jgi:hypothetical protein
VNANVLKLLLKGEYICPVRYADEFAALQDAAEREGVDQWLHKLNMRLARIGDEGAFFLAHDYIGAKDITQVKNELLAFRDVYGPAVQLLDFIRQTDSRTMLSPGEYLVLYELEAAVSHSSMFETQLKSHLGLITNASARNTNHENLRRLLEHLARDGYVALADKDKGTYQVTGKIEQLYAVLQFLDENKVIPDTEVDDREDQDDLVQQAQAADREGA